MELPTQSIAVTDLDFEGIKTSLTEYFKAGDSPFMDWDFTGSGLNMLLDVLSHNTHYNAVLAHMAINESFIDSAQLRPNVVSAAKLIGYTPRSNISSSSAVTVSAFSRSADLKEYVIPQGSIFTSNVTDFTKNRGYRFTNLADILCKSDDSGSGRLVPVGEVKINQGTFITKRIQVNQAQSRNRYLIDDQNIDINTLTVSVYQAGTDGAKREVYTRYTDLTALNLVNDGTPLYFLYENYDGNYEITFGNGIFGKKPDNINILEISYLVCDGAEANGSNIFSYTDTFDNTKLSKIEVSSVSRSSGGATRESISSIKYNAPLQYIAQNRAVTADDYKTLLTTKFGDIKAISVWGGEENDPPQYGKVFISVKPTDTQDISDGKKKEIIDFLSDKKVLAILPQIVDPEYVNVVLDVLFKYDRNLTTNTKVQLEEKVKATIAAYNTDYLEIFEGVFRYSLLTKLVDNTSPAILNSHIRVFVSKSVELLAGDPQPIILRYGTTLTVDDSTAIAKSSSWRYDGVTYFIGEEATAGTSDIRSLYVYYFDTDNVPIIRDRNIGTITLSTGVLELKPLLTDANTTLTLDLIPVSNDLAPRRNQLIQINNDRINIFGEVDTIAIGGSNRSTDYTTFNRDR